MHVPIMGEMAAGGEAPEYLFWVGCAGSYDNRAQKVTRAFVEILNKAGVSYAILGEEESCTGDPARRAGNEFVFQMSALQNIGILNGYNIQKIVATCPHCFNTLKNEYPDLGGHYEVIHHTQLLLELLKEKKLQIEGGSFKGEQITYHDSCYIGRINGIYEIPRGILEMLDIEFKEMRSCKERGLCCGAGGAQMFKEEEPGRERVSEARAEEAIATGAGAVAANCPFCLTMLQDGLTSKEREDMMVYDLAELVVQRMQTDDDQ